MSKVFLLSTNYTTEPYPVYPLGMAIIAGALEAGGHQTRQCDFLVAGKSCAAVVAAITEFQPDVIGLSLRNIDNVDSFSQQTAWYLAQAKELVESIRSCSSAPIIVGGAAFTIMPEEILTYLGCDHGVIGEGEGLICALVDGLTAGRSMPRLSNGEATPLSGAKIGSPLYVKEFVDFYLAESGQINAQSKRGCPHRCVYCTYPGIEGNRFRPLDPLRAVDEIARAQRDFGIHSFFFTDSVFNDEQGHYLRFVEELERRNLGITWTGFFRPQGIGREELQLMKRAGLTALELGTDAASDTTLAGLKKDFTIADVLAVNAACVAEQLPAAHYIMFGGPDESDATVREGLRNVEQINCSVVFAFSGIRILSGTELHGRAIADGVISAERELLMPAYYFSPLIDPQSMNAQILATFNKRREWIFPPSEGQEKLEVMRRFGFRGLLWDRLVSFEPKRRALTKG